MTTRPYTYLIGWPQYDKWYYGVRYAKGCSPQDFWVTYKTSSKHVHHFVALYGEPQIKLIRKVFDNKHEAILYENKVLRRLKVNTNDRWINKHCSGSAGFSTIGSVAVINKRTGNKEFIDLDTFHNSDEYVHINKGKVTVRVLTTNALKQISVDEYRDNRHMYQALNKGFQKSCDHLDKLSKSLQNRVPAFDLYTQTNVTIDRVTFESSDRFVGRFTKQNHTQQSRKKTSDKMKTKKWFNNGLTNIRIEGTAPPGFVPGRTYHRRTSQSIPKANL